MVKVKAKKKDDIKSKYIPRPIKKKSVKKPPAAVRYPYNK